jgi:hypothetical protein
MTTQSVNAFTPEDLNNLSILINKAAITGQDSMAVLLLQNKIQNQLNEIKAAAIKKPETEEVTEKKDEPAI